MGVVWNNVIDGVQTTTGCKVGASDCSINMSVLLANNFGKVDIAGSIPNGKSPLATERGVS